MPDVIIIADDLTGANDTGGRLARQGVTCALAPYWREDLPALGDSAAVWVFNTESRHCAPDEAARRVHCAAAWGRARGARVLYKKTDSVLRGPIGAELAAAQKTWNDGPLIYVPALPDAGRTVRDGHLFVYGVPLADTEFGADPLAPAVTGTINTVLRKTSDAAITTIPLAALRNGDNAIGGGSEIVIVEGETSEDLTQTATLVCNGRTPTCWAGPAAFASHLPALFNVRTGAAPPLAFDTPFLLVNGSKHPLAIAQTAAAVAAGFIPVVVCRETSSLDTALDALRTGRNVALYHHPKADDGPAGVSRRLIAAVEVLLTRGAPGTTILFGGETAQAVLRMLASQSCRIINEIALGLVLIETSGARGSFRIITKSGAFGTPDLIRECLL